MTIFNLRSEATTLSMHCSQKVWRQLSVFGSTSNSRQRAHFSCSFRSVKATSGLSEVVLPPLELPFPPWMSHLLFFGLDFCSGERAGRLRVLEEVVDILCEVWDSVSEFAEMSKVFTLL